MEKLFDELLLQILQRLDPNDRKSCSEVCKQWIRVESFTHSCLKLSHPEFLPAFLQRFTNLTSLEVYATMSDENLEVIGRMCPNIHTLNFAIWDGQYMSPDDFGDTGLCAISYGCPCLTKVSLRSRARITDYGVTTLVRNARNLTSLDLSWCDWISDDSLEVMGSVMTSLTELYLEGSQGVTDYGLICLAMGLPAKTLKSLDLSDCNFITDAGLTYMGNMSCLQDLDLSVEGLGGVEIVPEITDISGVAISAISGIRRLDLSCLVDISDSTLFALSRKCLNLVELNLTGCRQVTGAGLSYFAAHGSLRILCLSWSGIRAADVKMLESNFLSLRHVVLDYRMRRNISLANNLCRRFRVDWERNFIPGSHWYSDLCS